MSNATAMTLLDCYNLEFKNINVPDLNNVVKERLIKHPDIRGLGDKLVHVEDTFGNPKFWEELFLAEMKAIEQSSSTEPLKKAQKELIQQEKFIIESFYQKKRDEWHALKANDENSMQWTAVLFTLSRAFINVIKNEACTSACASYIEIRNIVKTSFTMNAEDLVKQFAGDTVKKQPILECLYYIGGWLITACNKFGKRLTKKNKIDQGSLGDILSTLFSDHTIEKDTSLPISKVENKENFGGLKFISKPFYHFVLRLETVFVKCLSPQNLFILGNKLIQNVYCAFIESIDVKRYILANLLPKEDNIEDETMNELTRYLCRTYVRMRGKDFVRNLMAIEFSNLTKALRSQLAAKSQPQPKNGGKKGGGGDSKVEDSFIYAGKKNLYQSTKVPALDEILKAEGLSLSGKKREKFERLKSHFKPNNNDDSSSDSCGSDSEEISNETTLATNEVDSNSDIGDDDEDIINHLALNTITDDIVEDWENEKSEQLLFQEELELSNGE